MEPERADGTGPKHGLVSSGFPIALGSATIAKYIIISAEKWNNGDKKVAPLES
jgi:hypothetical protein